MNMWLKRIGLNETREEECTELELLEMIIEILIAKNEGMYAGLKKVEIMFGEDIK